MSEILNYLENSSLVANVISFVVLGITGVLVKSIITAVANIAEQRKDLEGQGNLFTLLRMIATITYQTAQMYKNAVINSNLSPEAKNQALQTFMEVEKAYLALLPHLEGDEETAQDKNAVEALVGQFQEIGQDALTKLRDQLK